MMDSKKWVLLFTLSLLSLASSASNRAIIDVEGGPDSVVWVVQLSDLHFSVFHPERAQDFGRLVPPALSMINPSLVLITGDLTDGKSKDLLTMKQEESEWIEYENVMKDVIKRSGLNETTFYDLRGNHDSFGVPSRGGSYDFYQKYSVNSRLGRNGNVQSVTLQNSGRKHLFVGFDSTMEIGLRGPTNVFGHPTDKLLADLDTQLGQWDAQLMQQHVTKISFGHFPLSFSALSDSGKGLKDVFLKHSLSAYLCGHLHSRFGKNLKRHHKSGNHFLWSGQYYQYNIHQATQNNQAGEECANKAEPINEFWEWEMGDWRKSRVMRILAIDSGYVSLTDIDFKFWSKDIIVLPTFPVDSRFMQRTSSSRDYECQTERTSNYGAIRALIFSRAEVVSVTVKIYDTRPGNLNLVLDSAMRKLKENGTRGDLYVAPWNWRAFMDPSPDRYWLQIEAMDISGESSFSQLRPFSINGLIAQVDWTWKEFFVMGVQWAAIYNPILWTILPLLLSLLLIPRAFLICSKKQYTYKKISLAFTRMNAIGWLVNVAFWSLLELSRMAFVWSGILLYLLYLMFLPWFFGQVFTDSGTMAYATLKGWVVTSFSSGTEQQYTGVPDVMVFILPHLFFVVSPALLVIAAMAAEKAAYRSHYLSLSGKKKDDSYEVSKRHRYNSCSALHFWNCRWIRKIILLICLLILWKHWKNCRAVVKAYDMNPLLHSPAYCFSIPLLLFYTIYKTAGV